MKSQFLQFWQHTHTHKALLSAVKKQSSTPNSFVFNRKPLFFPWGR